MTAQDRRERQKEELQRDIVATAFECFAETGYHQTGIADIASRLGIGHGTFYRYFANKRDILDHVISDLVGRVVSALADENRPDAAWTLEDYRRQVARIGDSLIDVLGADTRMTRVLLFEATTVDAPLRDRMFGLLDFAREMTASYLRHGVDVGYLRPDLDVRNTAVAINGAILAMLLEDLRHPDGESRRRFSEALQHLMYVGISAP
ncbi:MAG: TetR/AcrR family transcriptional regulator [Nocardiaceae bacterium]|nr:TetR/AcrR family transcriptional regulator [Nocardiaceae bacterium]